MTPGGGSIETKDIEHQLLKIWEKKYSDAIDGDHALNGPTEQAEKRVINKFAEKICRKAEKFKWKVCSPNICIGESPIKDLRIPKGQYLFVIQDENTKQPFNNNVAIPFRKDKITFSLVVYKDDHQEVDLKELNLDTSFFAWDLPGFETKYGKTYTVHKDKIDFSLFGYVILSFAYADNKRSIFLNYKLKK